MRAQASLPNGACPCHPAGAQLVVPAGTRAVRKPGGSMAELQERSEYGVNYNNDLNHLQTLIGSFSAVSKANYPSKYYILI